MHQDPGNKKDAQTSLSVKGFEERVEKGEIKITKPTNVPPKRSVMTALDPQTLHRNAPTMSKATMSRKWDFAGDVDRKLELKNIERGRSRRPTIEHRR